RFLAWRPPHELSRRWSQLRPGGAGDLRDRHHLHADCVPGRAADAAGAVARPGVAGDVSGVELTRNPVGLIGALKKIAANDKPPERFNHAVAAMMIDNPEEHHGRFLSRLFDTHPPIEERIAALEKIASVQQT